MDGRGEDGPGSIDRRQLDRDRVSVKLNRDWPDLQETARRRRSAAEVLLQHLRDQLKPSVRGADLLVETTLIVWLIDEVCLKVPETLAGPEPFVTEQRPAIDQT